MYLTQDKCSVLLLKLSFFSLQTHTLVKGLGSWFPFVWIQCPNNRLHYSSIFRISADFTISPNHVLSMCPHETMLFSVGNASELLHYENPKSKSNNSFFEGVGRGIAHFPLGFTQYLCSQIIFDLNSCGFSFLVATFVTFSNRIFWGLILSYNMFSCFEQSHFSLPQSFSPFPYHGIIFLFAQHVLLIYVIFLVVYTTHCLDHISFQANCPNLLEYENRPKQNPSI